MFVTAGVWKPSRKQTCANGDRHPSDDMQIAKAHCFAAAVAGLIRQLATTIVAAAP
jgi:hypothetical protein